MMEGQISIIIILQTSDSRPFSSFCSLLPSLISRSTIISHGMPYPANGATAREVEQVVRDNGATPATIATRMNEVQIASTARAQAAPIQRARRDGGAHG